MRSGSTSPSGPSCSRSPSLLAPFAYSSMIWAVLIGATVFGTFPDLATVVGTAVLIGAGLYVWHREIVRGRERVRRASGTVPSRSLGASESGIPRTGHSAPACKPISRRAPSSRSPSSRPGPG